MDLKQIMETAVEGFEMKSRLAQLFPDALYRQVTVVAPVPWALTVAACFLDVTVPCSPDAEKMERWPVGNQCVQNKVAYFSVQAQEVDGLEMPEILKLIRELFEAALQSFRPVNCWEVHHD